MSDARIHAERLKDCALQVLLGEPIGRGTFRTVYAVDKDRVLKLETSGFSFSNAHEWTLWNDAQDTKWAKWLAPCLDIDEYGAALVMARTQPLTDEQWEGLQRVPSFMADVKRDNWGWHDGRAVCHDYGNHGMFSHGFKVGRIVRKKS